MEAWTSISGSGQTGIGGATKTPSPFFQRLTTRQVAPRDRLDCWRQFFTAPLIDKPPAAPALDDYQGELLRSASCEGIAFVNIHADPNVCHFGRRDSGLVLLGHLRSGQVSLRHGNGEISVLRPDSGLMLFDCDRTESMSATRHDMSYLVLPRAFVAAAAGGDPFAHGAPAFRLLNGGLAPILWAHLEALTAHGERLSEFEARAAVQAAGVLATALLAGARRQRHGPGAFDEALFVAASRYLELNAGNCALTAERAAAALGCSRARLYRLFARHGQTVAGCLRALRLRRARLLLETRPDMTVGAAALLCGYTDLSAFGKAFRRRFGMAPCDYRKVARGRHFKA